MIPQTQAWANCVWRVRSQLPLGHNSPNPQNYKSEHIDLVHDGSS